MTRIPKRELLRRFELAIQDAGARLIYRSSPGQHPASSTIVHRDGRASRVLLDIWNMTHGGGAARPAHEYRIQITGMSQFENPPGEKTLILGWSNDFEVFAGFDCRRHSGVSGASPSMQISRDALRAAQIRGFAPYEKGSGETAVAFRSDFAAAYVENLHALHDTGAVPAEAAIRERISEDPEAVGDADIDAAVAPARREEIVATRRAARDALFRRKVLTAYGNRCAMCGVQLRLLDAAHVLPVDRPGSTDDTNNGVCPCALHHRAYDARARRLRSCLRDPRQREAACRAYRAVPRRRAAAVPGRAEARPSPASRSARPPEAGLHRPCEQGAWLVSMIQDTKRALPDAELYLPRAVLG